MDKLRINSFGRGPGDDAAAQAHFAAEDLEIEHAVTNSSKAQMQELVDGVWDVVHTNSDNVFYWSEDREADIVIVLASPGAANQDFIVRPEIEDYDDLRGQVIAVDAAESGYATPLRVLLREHGLNQEGKDYHFLQVGATQQRIDAMKDGRAVGAMVGSTQARTLAEEGFRDLDSINRLYREHAGAAVTTRVWARANQALLIRYLRGYLRSTRAAQGAVLSFAWDGLREMLEMRADLGLLRGPPDPHRFADDRYYQQAVASL